MVIRFGLVLLALLLGALSFGVFSDASTIRVLVARTILTLDPERPDLVIDVRYSMLPNRVDALWGIQLDRNAGPADHPGFVTFRTLSPADRRAFLAMLAFGDSSRDE